MNTEPVICFGQQPCGFFPKRFLVSKINTAKKLQSDIGGRIVFFYHDSDADYRETITVMRDRATGAEVRLNFLQPNKIQKKFSPLYAKRIAPGWKQEMLKQLPRFLRPSPPLGEMSPVHPRDREGAPTYQLTDFFSSTDENQTVADFCLEMYKKMGLLDGIEVVRSGDKEFRMKAPDLDKDYFADVEYQGEIVRAKIEPPPSPSLADEISRKEGGRNTEDNSVPPSFLRSTEHKEGARGSSFPLIGTLHEGGNKFIRFPIEKPIEKWQKNPGRDQRFGWMQSVINCTHYIYGEGEKQYLDVKPFPNIKFIDRDHIENANYAWLGNI